jgi:hypothetical protein
MKGAIRIECQAAVIRRGARRILSGRLGSEMETFSEVIASASAALSDAQHSAGNRYLIRDLKNQRC